MFDGSDYNEVDAMDTFDEGPYTQGPMNEKETSQGGEKSTETKSQEAKSSQEGESFDEDSQVNQLDEKEEKAAKSDEKKSDKGDEEDKSGDKESKDSESDKDTPADKDAQPTGKTVKAFQDGKRYEIPQDAEVRVKVDGKNVKVPVQELINNYSGKESWDKKFSELSEEKNQYQAEKEQYTQEKEYIQRQLFETRQLAVKALQGEANPLDFVNNLLDQMNLNSYDFHKALRESMAEEWSLYSEMTEVEREAYELKQRNEFLERKQETSEKTLQEQKAQEELLQYVDSLRQTHGVSEEEYVSAHNALSELGGEFSAEDVVKYAAMVEPTIRAEQLVEPYLEQLSDEKADELIVQLAREFYADKSLTNDEVAKFLAEEYEVEDIVSTLEEKVVKEDNNFQYGKNRPQEESTGIESFDDFDNY